MLREKCFYVCLHIIYKERRCVGQMDGLDIKYQPLQMNFLDKCLRVSSFNERFEKSEWVFFCEKEL